MPWRSPQRGLFLAMVVNLVLMAAAAVLSVGASRSNCRDRVEVRDDNRAMWVFLTGEVPGNELAARTRAQLDVRLPELRCTGWLGTHPVPAPTSEEP